MAVVRFTENLNKHLVCPPQSVPGETVAQLFRHIFQENPFLEGYILDEQGALRRHVNVFVNGHRIKDRQRLSDQVGPTSEVYVIQALSGG